MALIACTECYELISDTAKICPKCGAVTELSLLITQLKDGKRARFVLWLLVLWPFCGLVIASVMYYFDYGTNPVSCVIQAINKNHTQTCQAMFYFLQRSNESMMVYMQKSNWIVWAWLICIVLLILACWYVSKIRKMIGDRHKV